MSVRTSKKILINGDNFEKVHDFTFLFFSWIKSEEKLVLLLNKNSDQTLGTHFVIMYVAR